MWALIQAFGLRLILRYRTPIMVVATLLVGILSTVIYFTASSGFGLLVLSLVGIAIYYRINGALPPIWAMVVLICIPLFIWGFEVIKPNWYLEWRGSRLFWWMVLTGMALGWLSNHRSAPLASVARIGLMALMVTAVLIGAYGKRQEIKAEILPTPATSPTPTNVIMAASSDFTTLKSKTLQHGETFSIAVPPGHRVDAWPEGLQEHWSMNGSDLILTLSVDKETEIKYRVYLCTVLTPCDKERPKMTDANMPAPEVKPAEPPAEDVLPSRPLVPPMPKGSIKA